LPASLAAAQQLDASAALPHASFTVNSLSVQLRTALNAPCWSWTDIARDGLACRREAETFDVTDLKESLLRAPLTRRPLLLAAAALVLAPSIALAEEKADATTDFSAELAKPGPIPDLALGNADAPVTIHEYASMTCPHCAAFHTGVLPKLKEKYIDPGKVRLVMRDFPLDNLAAAASMLVRCTGEGKSVELMSVLFASQDNWAFVQGNPVPALFKIASDHGFTKESFDKCLTDQKLLDGITTVRDRANKVLGVRATPTFFINGKKLNDRSDQIESFDRAIEPLLKQ
jgi:protein-disulfide isomerase